MKALYRFSPLVGLLVLCGIAIMVEMARDYTCRRDKSGDCNELFSAIAFVVTALMCVVCVLAVAAPHLFGGRGSGGGGSYRSPSMNY